MKTATGNFPLGWRRRNFAWEQDLDGMIAWALENELEVIDLGRDADSITKTVVNAGLRVGSADLTVWGEMMSRRCRGAPRRRRAERRIHSRLRRRRRGDLLHLHDSRRSNAAPRRELRLYGR